MSRTTTPPQHGERRCYLRGCRRPECLDAHYRYMSRYRLDSQRGQNRRTDLQTTVEHIQQLIDLGWTQAQISRASGLAHRTVNAAVRGDYTHVSVTTARKILAVPLGPAPATDAQYVDATGTARRLRALVAIGHTFASIAPHAGLREDPIRAIAAGKRTQVVPATAKAVAAAYRTLSRTPGISVRARLMAQRNGWHGPLAWDEHAIDDPAAQPDGDAEEAHLARNELAALRRAEIEHLDSFGVPEHEIAERLGMGITTVHAIVRELHTGQRRERAPKTEVAA